MKRSEGTWGARFKKAVSQDFEFIVGSNPALVSWLVKMTFSNFFASSLTHR
jgi:hypothetical protein